VNDAAVGFVCQYLLAIFHCAPKHYICDIKSTMQPRLLLDSKRLNLTITRLCHQLIEQHKDFSNTVLIGVQPRGVFMADRIYAKLSEILQRTDLQYGKLDITFYRDDFRTKGAAIVADETSIDCSLENKNIILVDDVLYTGRTIRAALDSMLDYGRPADVELLVLVDRRKQRHLPIQAKYVGHVIDSITAEKVKVEWKETDGADKVWIVADKKSEN